MATSKRLIIAAFAVLLTLLAVALVGVARDDSPSYDEAGHRAALQELLGETIDDSWWASFKESGRELCESDFTGYSPSAAGRLSVVYMCPDRLDLYESTVN
ncbi:MAG: hypothetical protein ACRD0W_19700 [Acidimicrobiales bacterium]